MNSIKLNGKDIYPSKIVCIGRNYVEHIEELKNEIPTEPVIFIKPNSAIANDLCTQEKDDIHYEGEITFLIQSGKLYAVGFGLDLTKREIQSHLKAKGLPWERAKAFDGSAVLSDFVHFDGKIEDLRMELLINGKLIQQASYDLMLNKPHDLLTEIKTFLSLEDGDLIMTGTPKGVGKVNSGDVFSGKIFHKNNLLIESTWVAK
jgi:2-keto-4-pentenoate hydratase/2-oxohepta-3-ene-1,7-dioic acid hydratase in catechol pathway